jgi:hypothetical protein
MSNQTMLFGAACVMLLLLTKMSWTVFRPGVIA